MSSDCFQCYLSIPGLTTGFLSIQTEAAVFSQASFYLPFWQWTWRGGLGVPNFCSDTALSIFPFGMTKDNNFFLSTLNPTHEDLDLISPPPIPSCEHSLLSLPPCFKLVFVWVLSRELPHSLVLGCDHSMLLGFTWICCLTLTAWFKVGCKTDTGWSASSVF